MKDKEALDDYKDFGKIKGESTTSNQTFVPSRFHNEWRQKYFEEIEDVNLRADMVCARNDELENKLSKYERAFGILKEELEIDIVEDIEERMDDDIVHHYMIINDRFLKKEKIIIDLMWEEYELLEELMKND